MKFIKKTWILLVVLAAILAGYFIRGAFYTPDNTAEQMLQQQNATLQDRHVQDSIATTIVVDSLTKLRDSYKAKIAQSATIIRELKVKYAKERLRIDTLSAPEDLAEFNQRVGGCGVLIVNGPDTSANIEKMAVKRANLLFMELDEATDLLAEKDRQIAWYDTVQGIHYAMFEAKDKRIVNLTKDYYDSRKIIASYQSLTDDYKKKMRRKNWMLGGAIGVGVGGVIIGVIAH